MNSLNLTLAEYVVQYSKLCLLMNCLIYFFSNCIVLIKCSKSVWFLWPCRSVPLLFKVLLNCVFRKSFVNVVGKLGTCKPKIIEFVFLICAPLSVSLSSTYTKLEKVLCWIKKSLGINTSEYCVTFATDWSWHLKQGFRQDLS